jgi:hypothetical protein
LDKPGFYCQPGAHSKKDKKHVRPDKFGGIGDDFYQSHINFLHQFSPSISGNGVLIIFIYW